MSNICHQRKNQEELSGEQPHVALNQASFTQSITPAPNSNHQKQLRFFSTKKKIHHNKRWVKPTLIEEAKAKKKLATTLVKLKYALCVGRKMIMRLKMKCLGFSVTLVMCGITFHVQLHHQRIQQILLFATFES